MYLVHKLFAAIHKHGWLTFGLLSLISYILSIFAFKSLSGSNLFEPIMLLQAFTLSFEGLPDNKNWLAVIAKLSWIITFASAAFSLFLRDWSHQELFEDIKQNKHTAIIGISTLSHNYINDLDKNTTIIFNTDNRRISSQQFKDKGYAIKEANIEDIANSINVKTMDKVLINTGSDRDNINIAFQIIESYRQIYKMKSINEKSLQVSKYTNRICKYFTCRKKLSNYIQRIRNKVNQINNDIKIIKNEIKDLEAEITQLRLIVRIENRELNTLFLSNDIFRNSDYKLGKIELKTYSFFGECAAKLFQDNYIDGDDNSIIKTDKEYSIAIVGDGKLATSIVYEAANIAHLPNENTLNVYLISKNPKEFKESLIRNYPNLKEIPTLELHEKVLDYKSFECYKNDENSVWNIEGLTNIIVCYDDENVNLEIASSMQDKIFLRKETIDTKVLFGVFNQSYISDKVNNDKKYFKNFKSFGDSKEILSHENIFEDKNYQLAKLINYTYDGLLYDKSKGKEKFHKCALFDGSYEKIDFAWFKASHNDKESSLAQAKHIKMKLKALGLEFEKVYYQTPKKILKHNRKMIDPKLKVKFRGNYPFPKRFDDTLFHRMIRLEHNRWNAYHYINGWSHEPYENIKPLKNDKKDQKLHNCLIPILDFPNYVPSCFKDSEELSTLIQWDIYAFMYIPNYLAEARYKIISLDSKS